MGHQAGGRVPVERALPCSGQYGGPRCSALSRLLERRLLKDDYTDDEAG